MAENNISANTQPKKTSGGPGSGGPMMRGMGGGKAKDFGKTFRRLLHELKEFRVKLILMIILSVLGTVGSIFIPKILAGAINRLFAAFTGTGGSDMMGAFQGGVLEFNTIQNILIFGASLYALSTVLSFVSGWLMAGMSQKLVYRLRKEICEKLTKVPLKYYDNHTHGEILSRITNDLDTVSTSLSQSLTQIIQGIITIVGILIMMLTINWILTLITLAIIPVAMVLIMIVMKFSQRFFTGNQKYLGQLNGHVEEMYTGHKIVKAFNHEERAIKEFGEINENLYHAGWKSQFFSGLMFPIMTFVNNLGYVVISVVGMIFVSQNKLNAGDALAFVQYTNQFTQPVAQMAQIMNLLQSTMAASERVFETLDEKEETPDKENAKELPKVRGDISFKNVKFGYSEDKILMHDMNIDVRRGQMVAIVGPTGAGKTTIVNLLMRFYDISGGAIYLDGTNIYDVKRSALRNNIGMVLQDTWLFNGTIRDNIAYGKPDATDQEIKDAAFAAQAHRFIKTLEGGYNAVINEEASNLSQGQKQLLTIARALLADPSVLILDEATSSVDTITEIHIQAAMAELMKNRTSFVIAHRLSTIKDADNILVMDHGDIVEFGNHEQLMEKKGFYCDLYNSQFSLNETAWEC